MSQEQSIEIVEYKPVWDLAREQFRLDESSIHGESHWRDVFRNGAEIAEETPGADSAIVKLFAILHDCCRENDGYDPEHGPRAASLLKSVGEQYFAFLTQEQREILEYAIANHTTDKLIDDPTIGCCWDADRLDYGRDGTQIEERFLSTEAARIKLSAEE